MDVCTYCGNRAHRLHACDSRALRDRIDTFERVLDATAKRGLQHLKRAEDADKEASACLHQQEEALEAITQAHVALGGDGEWGARPGSTCMEGETGDLAIDVPAMAAKLREERDAMQAEGRRQADDIVGLRSKVAELDRQKDDLRTARNELHRLAECQSVSLAEMRQERDDTETLRQGFATRNVALAAESAKLRAALEEAEEIAQDAATQLCEMSSADGSGHADLGRRIRERLAALHPPATRDRMRYRPQRGGLAAAMLECVELDPTYEALRVHLDLSNDDDLRVEEYSGADKRIGWERTSLVRVNGDPVGFTDGMPKSTGEPE